MASKHLPELGPDDAPYLTDEQIKQLRPAKEFFAELGIPVPRMGRPKAEKVKQQEQAQIPLQRRGEPADIARWIVALADPAANWMTGQIITVDGGLGLV